MRVAIILTGNIRTWDRCKKSHFDCFNHLNADIFVSTYDRKYEYHPYVQSQITNHKDVIIDTNDIIESLEGLNVIDVDIENAETVDEEVTELEFDKQMLNIDSCYKQYRKIQRGIKLIEEYESLNNFEYDIIIKLRFDTVFNKVDIIPTNPRDVIINNNGVLPNDWVICSSRDNFININNFMMNEFFIPRYKNSAEAPPHQLFKNGIDSNGLNMVKKHICKRIVRVDEK